jgi:16S rRNA (adenine1518-N6/adenine1519-N6)-dimethyltransferase
VKARKRFGQHFLERPWADKIVQLIAPTPDDRLIEIGPGRGALTAPLAETGVPIRAIEIDRDLAGELGRALPPHVSIVSGDFLSLSAADLFDTDAPTASSSPDATAVAPAAQPIRIVGNLPYNLSSPILIRLLALARETGRLRDATIMLQREVADRVTATPGGGDWGPLGVLVSLHADTEVLLQLPPGAFRPPPKVRSTVVRLRFRPFSVDVGDYRRFDTMVRTIFQQRRKTLANALKPLLPPDHSAADLLRSVDLDPIRRPETLSLVELAALARARP